MLSTIPCATTKKGKYQHTATIDEETRTVAEHMFIEADKDGDLKLHTPELHHFAEVIDPRVESQDVQIIKTFLDMNGDMNLSCEEFVPFVELILKNRAAREETLVRHGTWEFDGQK